MSFLFTKVYCLSLNFCCDARVYKKTRSLSGFTPDKLLVIDMAEKHDRSLQEKLNADLEEFVSNLKPSSYKEGWSEDNWENEMQQHPLFMSEALKAGDELPPLVEALQQLKYDPAENTSSELAANYKDDGNQNFKLKKYRWAVDSYTEGLKQKCPDLELNAQLYANRAAAHFYLGNYRSSLQDCISAKNLQPNYVKVIARGAMCCKELKSYAECTAWCDEALKLNASDASIMELKTFAEKAKVQADRDKRRKTLEEKKQKLKEELLIKALKERKPRLKDGADEDGDINISKLEPSHLAAVGHQVHLDHSNRLVWPVIFLYAEYGVTDVIQSFVETTTFNEHLDVMFPEANELPWDLDKKYFSNHLHIYFENSFSEKLVQVYPCSSLKDVLSDERYLVSNGTPIFFLTVRNSSFDKEFRERHGIDS